VGGGKTRKCRARKRSGSEEEIQKNEAYESRESALFHRWKAQTQGKEQKKKKRRKRHVRPGKRKGYSRHGGDRGGTGARKREKSREKRRKGSWALLNHQAKGLKGEKRLKENADKADKPL